MGLATAPPIRLFRLSRIRIAEWGIWLRLADSFRESISNNCLNALLIFFEPPQIRRGVQKMKFATLLLSLVMACLVAANVSAQRNTSPKSPLAVFFEKMDTNHDGILTVQEFAAANSKLGAGKELATLGGTVQKGEATGMTFQQFAKAYKE
jgi:hypothetical protein